MNNFKNKSIARFVLLGYMGIIGLLLLGGMSVNFVSYQAAYPNIYKALLLFGIVLLPLGVLLFADTNFREQSPTSRLLIAGISSFLISIHFNIHFNYIFTLVFGVGLLADLVYRRKWYRPGVLHILFFIYAAINALSLLWTNDLDLGLYWLKLQTALWYIPLAFCLFRLDRKQFDIVLVAVFRWGVMFAFLSVCSWILQSRAWEIPLSEALVLHKHFLKGIHDPFAVVFAWSNYTHPTFISIALMLGLSVGWYYAVRNVLSWYELLFCVLAVLFIAVLTQSRFMQLTWLTGNVIAVFYLIRSRRRLQIGLSAVVVSIVVMLALLFPGYLKTFFMDNVRIAHYKAAFQAIEENPLGGAGLGGMPKYINSDNPVYYPVKEQTAAVIRQSAGADAVTDVNSVWIGFIGSNPHNQIVGDMMQTGILGLFSILSLLIYIGYLSVKQRNQLLMSAFATFFLLMLIEMPLMVENGIMSFVLVICFLASKPMDETV